MSVDNHEDIAEDAFAAADLPDPPRTVEDVLPYITILLSKLPKSERAGYVKGPAGGENVAPLHDGRGLVRISRVMYPDGQIIKVMNDAPNGGPQWVEEDVRPELYVPYLGEFPPPDPEPEPEPPPELGTQMRLDAMQREIDGLHAILDDQAGFFAGKIEDLERQLHPQHGHVHGKSLFGRETGPPRWKPA